MCGTPVEDRVAPAKRHRANAPRRELARIKAWIKACYESMVPSGPQVKALCSRFLPGGGGGGGGPSAPARVQAFGPRLGWPGAGKGRPAGAQQRLTVGAGLWPTPGPIKTPMPPPPAAGGGGIQACCFELDGDQCAGGPGRRSEGSTSASKGLTPPNLFRCQKVPVNPKENQPRSSSTGLRPGKFFLPTKGEEEWRSTAIDMCAKPFV